MWRGAPGIANLEGLAALRTTLDAPRRAARTGWPVGGWLSHDHAFGADCRWGGAGASSAEGWLPQVPEGDLRGL
ncbi:hypothetical protein GCM10009754_49400 [Amycolatopsis minnesotensis]|uniref:Uncharacterized protein n=1 Tax=Amycolatopsis minnesotensis TaxID=337894 RepID=A0ABN2RIW0_9PSEU